MAVADKRARTRLVFCVFFILMGIAIISGTYVMKHYKGSFENYEPELAIEGSTISQINAMYPYNIGNIGSTLYYDFDRADIIPLKGLTYVVWDKVLGLIIGLLYIWMGIKSKRDKGFLFR